MAANSGSQPPQSRHGQTQPPAVTLPRVVAAVCVVLPVVAMLGVGTYTRTSPVFIGIPFFYWYQIAWVPITAGLTALAYVMIRRDERARRGQTAEIVEAGE